jgi:hypothetical protein
MQQNALSDVKFSPLRDQKIRRRIHKTPNIAGMLRITTFRSMKDRVYDGGP